MGLINLKHTSSGVTVIELNAGPVNVLSHELILELSQVVREATGQGLILTSAQKVFCAGLDFKELLGSRESLKNYLSDFLNLTLDFMKCKIPVVFAVNGSCAAGGTVLSLTADYRVMTRQTGSVIGLNELEVGLPVPKIIHSLMASVVGDQIAYQSIMTAVKYDPEKAYDVSLVHELSDDPLASAIEQMERLLLLSQSSWSITKCNLKTTLVKEFQSNMTSELEDLLDFTSLPAFRESLMKKLGGRA